MGSLETQCAVRVCPGVRNGRGHEGAVAVHLPRQGQVFQGKEAPHPVNAGPAVCGRVFDGK